MYTTRQQQYRKTTRQPLVTVDVRATVTMTGEQGQHRWPGGVILFFFSFFFYFLFNL